MDPVQQNNPVSFLVPVRSINKYIRIRTRETILSGGGQDGITYIILIQIMGLYEKFVCWRLEGVLCVEDHWGRELCFTCFKSRN